MGGVEGHESIPLSTFGVFGGGVGKQGDEVEGVVERKEEETGRKKEIERQRELETEKARERESVEVRVGGSGVEKETDGEKEMCTQRLKGGERERGRIVRAVDAAAEREQEKAIEREREREQDRQREQRRQREMEIIKEREREMEREKMREREKIRERETDLDQEEARFVRGPSPPVSFYPPSRLRGVILICCQYPEVIFR